MDKRFSFPFGANLMTPLERLRDLGLSVRFDTDKEQLMIKPSHIASKWSAYIAEHRQQIIEELDSEKKEAAMARLPFPDFEAGPVELRTAYLLKVFGGEYLAVTEEEMNSLGGSGSGGKTDE